MAVCRRTVALACATLSSAFLVASVAAKRPEAQSVAYDVLREAEVLLAGDPSITTRINVPQQISLWFGLFFAIDGLSFLLLARVMTSGTPWGSRVKIRASIVSLAHDLLTIPLVHMLLAAVSHKASGPGGLLGIGPLTHIPMALIDRAGCVFIGFLLWDCVHTVTHSRTYAKSIVENLTHHVAFLVMIWLNRDTLWCNYVFPVLLMGEWSTLFLNVRVIYRLLGRTEMLVSVAFALVFFLTRVVVFGLVVLQFWSQLAPLRQLLSPSLQLSYLGLLPLVYGLNLFWFAKICSGIIRVLRGGDDGPADGYSDQSGGSTSRSKQS